MIIKFNTKFNSLKLNEYFDKKVIPVMVVNILKNGI